MLSGARAPQPGPLEHDANLGIAAAASPTQIPVLGVFLMAVQVVNLHVAGGAAESSDQAARRWTVVGAVTQGPIRDLVRFLAPTTAGTAGPQSVQAVGIFVPLPIPSRKGSPTPQPRPFSGSFFDEKMLSTKSNVSLFSRAEDSEQRQIWTARQVAKYDYVGLASCRACLKRGTLNTTELPYLDRSDSHNATPLFAARRTTFTPSLFLFLGSPRLTYPVTRPHDPRCSRDGDASITFVPPAKKQAPEYFGNFVIVIGHDHSFRLYFRPLPICEPRVQLRRERVNRRVAGTWHPPHRQPP